MGFFKDRVKDNKTEMENGQKKEKKDEKKKKEKEPKLKPGADLPIK